MLNEPPSGKRLSRNPGLTPAIGAVVLTLAWLTVGCETTDMTTLAESSAAYADARAFLETGFTTNTEVRAKYGEPQQITPWERGDMWRYERVETIMVNAYTGTSLGIARAMYKRRNGYRETIRRKKRMDLYFNRGGVLVNYDIIRDAP